ncbi:MAG: hypothetical protein KIT18_06575 [Burkholderiales bacterium]|nr:hypothetical protein [Burkholderiales bacterium]
MQLIRIATKTKLLQRTRNPIDNLSRKPDIQLTKTRSTSSPTAFQIAASAILPPPPALAAPSPLPDNFPNEINRLAAATRPQWRATVIELSQTATATRRAERHDAGEGPRKKVIPGFEAEGTAGHPTSVTPAKAGVQSTSDFHPSLEGQREA